MGRVLTLYPGFETRDPGLWTLDLGYVSRNSGLEIFGGEDLEEHGLLRRQFGTLKRGEHSKYPPMAFTEQGVAMLSSVLNSWRAVEVNVLIMRAFVRLRQMAASHKDLLVKIEEMERRYDAQFKVVFEAIRQLMAPLAAAEKKIGFQVKEKRAPYGRR